MSICSTFGPQPNDSLMNVVNSLAIPQAALKSPTTLETLLDGPRPVLETLQEGLGL